MSLRKFILPIVGLTTLVAGTYLLANNGFGFKNFGEVVKYIDYDIQQIIIADLDGDGDLDIIVGLKQKNGLDSKIITYENEIPQKK